MLYWQGEICSTDKERFALLVSSLTRRGLLHACRSHLQVCSMRAGHIYRFSPCVQVTSTGLLHACRSHLQVCSMRAGHIYRFAPCVQVTSTGLLHACRSHLRHRGLRRSHRGVPVPGVQCCDRRDQPSSARRQRSGAGDGRC